jgi:hypothetical protein
MITRGKSKQNVKGYTLVQEPLSGDVKELYFSKLAVHKRVQNCTRPCILKRWVSKWQQHSFLLLNHALYEYIFAASVVLSGGCPCGRHCRMPLSTAMLVLYVGQLSENPSLDSQSCVLSSFIFRWLPLLPERGYNCNLNWDPLLEPTSSATPLHVIVFGHSQTNMQRKLF